MLLNSPDEKRTTAQCLAQGADAVRGYGAGLRRSVDALMLIKSDAETDKAFGREAFECVKEVYPPGREKREGTGRRVTLRFNE